MVVFNEEEYGEKIYKDGFSHYNGRNIERCVFIRYLYDKGFQKGEIIEELKKRKIKGDEFLSSDDLDIIYGRLIDKAISYPFMNTFSIDIYEEEYEFIDKIEDSKVKIVAFCLLVYYKWCLSNKSLCFLRGDKNFWCIDPELDIFKMAHLSSLKPKYRNAILRNLSEIGYYETDVINKDLRTNIYMLINAPKIKTDKIVGTITDSDDIYGEFLLLFSPNLYKRCQSCRKIIKIKSNSQKRCPQCAKKSKIASTVENRKIRNASI